MFAAVGGRAHAIEEYAKHWSRFTCCVKVFWSMDLLIGNAPPIQFSARARYEWAMAGYVPYVQVGLTHTGHSFTQAGSNPTIADAGGISTGRLRFENPAYTTVSASVGVSKDSWYANLFGENLSNSNASTFVSTDQFIVAQTPLRPRVLGAEFGYKF